jgi:N utilization substance protein B
MGKRRKARELALQILFQIEVGKIGLEEALSSFWLNQAPHIEREVKEFTTQLVKGTRENLKTIDILIDKNAENWTIERIAKVDCNILRSAIYEILHRPEIPVKVTINEAIELAKKYSSSESYQFVNGILDRIAKRGQATF